MKLQFKAKTINAYKMLLAMDERIINFVQDNFIVSEIDIEPLNSKFLKVTDKSGESLLFTCINDEIKYFEPSRIEEFINYKQKVAQQELEGEEPEPVEGV